MGLRRSSGLWVPDGHGGGSNDGDCRVTMEKLARRTSLITKEGANSLRFLSCVFMRIARARPAPLYRTSLQTEPPHGAS